MSANINNETSFSTLHMRPHHILVTWLLFLGVAGAAPADAQTPIAASRRVDWSQVGIPTGIPNRETVCATLNPGATAAQINAAIASCPANQVVFLTAGTYTLSSGLDFRNKTGVTLRGAGPDRTTLVFSGSVNCHGMNGNVCIRNNELNYTGQPVHLANWTGGYTKGATQITLSSTTGLAPGSIVILDQLNDANVDTGGIWICSTINVCSVEGTGGGGRPNREQTQIVRVTAISGNTVSISPGLNMPNWRASQTPQAWWGNTVTRGVGLEDLTLDHTNSNELAGIFFFNAYNCWVRNVRSLNANRNHVWLFQTAATVVRDSYFYGTKNNASQSYGVESYLSADNLVENNIFERIVAPTMANGSATGSVFSYNYMTNMFYSPAPQFMFAGHFVHGPGIDMILHEGNDGNGIHADEIHGTHHFITAFRNYFTGWEPGRSRATVPVNLYAFTRYSNIVGNVLGTPGYHTTYEWNVSGSNKDTAIYNLGSGNSNAPSDSLVRTTLFRWGNYDTVTGAARFDPAEVPSAIGPYSNPVPAGTGLPPSLYLSAKPAWWSDSIPWPPIGPDVTGGTGPGGRAHRIPAHVCYDSTAKTANGILTFNAANCYSRGPSTPGPLPAAPTNLRIVPAG